MTILGVRCRCRDHTRLREEALAGKDCIGGRSRGAAQADDDKTGREHRPTAAPIGADDGGADAVGAAIRRGAAGAVLSRMTVRTLTSAAGLKVLASVRVPGGQAIEFATGRPKSAVTAPADVVVAWTTSCVILDSREQTSGTAYAVAFTDALRAPLPRPVDPVNRH